MARYCAGKKAPAVNWTLLWISLRNSAVALPEEQAKIVQALHKDLTAIHTTLSETQSAEAEPQAVILTEGERWTEAITGARDIFRPVVGELNKAALQARPPWSNP